MVKKPLRLRLAGALNQVTEIQDECGELKFSVATEIWFLITISFEKIFCPVNDNRPDELLPPSSPQGRESIGYKLM
jgi:hypothetical protein